MWSWRALSKWELLKVLHQEKMFHLSLRWNDDPDIYERLKRLSRFGVVGLHGDAEYDVVGEEARKFGVQSSNR